MIFVESAMDYLIEMTSETEKHCIFGDYKHVNCEKRSREKFEKRRQETRQMTVPGIEGHEGEGSGEVLLKMRHLKRKTVPTTTTLPVTFLQVKSLIKLGQK